MYLPSGYPRVLCFICTIPGKEGNMKKVVIFGAAGHTGKYITKKMQSAQDIELSVFVRNPAKFEDMDLTGVNVIQGDALNAEDVKKAMEGQDVLLCSLEGDVLTMAHNRGKFCSYDAAPVSGNQRWR